MLLRLLLLEIWEKAKREQTSVPPVQWTERRV